MNGIGTRRSRRISVAMCHGFDEQSSVVVRHKLEVTATNVSSNNKSMNDDIFSKNSSKCMFIDF